MNIDKKDRLVFAVAEVAYERPILVVGVSQASWDWMKDGKTHTIDLAEAGIPFRLMIFGGKTQQECLDMIAQGEEQIEKLKEYGIKEPTKQ